MKLMKTKLDRRSLAVEETLFHTANGYLGVRGCFEEGYPADIQTIRGTYINGFYDTVELSYPERLYGFPTRSQRLINLPDVQTIKLFLDDEEFSIFTGDLPAYERVLDMNNGVAERHVRRKSPRKKTVVVHITRMASFERPELFLTKYSLESVDFEGRVRFVGGINCAVTNFADSNDPRVASEQMQHIHLDSAEIVEDMSLVKCSTDKSGLQLAISQQFVVCGDVKSEAYENGIHTTILSDIKPGEIIAFDKYTVMSDSRRQKNPSEHAFKTLKDCVRVGAKSLLLEQRSFLKNFWAVSKIDLLGAKEINEQLNFNIYQLLQSAGRDAVGNVASKGISGEGYEGHYFWDTEIYIFPFFLYTQPDTARALLTFRYNTLNEARNHARIMGHTKGALYPWRTISGSECSSFFPAGSAQYHLTGDVAYSFLQYYYATGDIDYMASCAAEVLIETARLWLETGNYDSDGSFHIHAVTGPDEYTCCVSDNYYTNLCAQYNLRGAVEIYTLLKDNELHSAATARTNFDESELIAFTQAANAMFLPYDEKLGIYAQDSTFLDKPVWNIADTPKEKFPLLLHYHPLYLYRFQVCKQADTVLAHFLFEESVCEDDIRRSYAYYDKITTHDSSLSGCIYGIMASRLGMAQKAYDYFVDTVRCDLDDMHGNTKDGLHVANLGGAWLSVVFGFAGMRLFKDGLHFRFSLPKQWKGYSFRICYQGRLLKINVTEENSKIISKFILEKGTELTVFVDGSPRLVK